MFIQTNAVDIKKSHPAPLKAAGGTVSFPSRTIVHPKLEMTEPGDSNELEADAAANEVMSGKVSRQISGSSTGGGVTVSAQMESRLNSLQGNGHVMPDSLRNLMECGFNRDFSQVRFHTDSEAAEMSGSINAKAFTLGNDIYFNQGQFSPFTSSGQRLIAHELAHVAQGGRTVARQEDDSPAARIRRSKVMSDIHYCELRIDGLIDALKEQDRLDHSIVGFFVGLTNWDGFDADELIKTLKEAKPVLNDLRNSKNYIEEIDKGVHEILRVIRTVDNILAAHRNKNISIAESEVTSLNAIKTTAFITAGILAAGIAAPVIAPAVTAAVSGMATTAMPYVAATTAGATLIGGAAALTGSMATGAFVGGSMSAMSSSATEVGKGLAGEKTDMMNVVNSTANGAVSGAITGGMLKAVSPLDPNPLMMQIGGQDFVTREVLTKAAIGIEKYHQGL